MSLDFVIKDISRNWEYSKSYIKSIIIAGLLFTIIIQMINGIGYYIFSKTTNLFNYTTNDLFLQYFQVIIYLMIIIFVIWILIINHNIIMYKTRDLSILKAIGSLSNRINGIYISEIYLIDIIGIILGIFFGFLIYLIIFFIFGTIYPETRFHIDLFYTPITIFIILGIVYIINGYELRRLSSKRFGDLKTDEIRKQYYAAYDLKLVPKIISKFGLLWKVSVINLKRKKGQFYRILIFLIVVLTLVIILISSGILMDNTIKSQIKGAQGENIFIFGHKDIVELYKKRYEQFSNPNLIFTNQEFNLLDEIYLFNDSIIEEIQNSPKYMIYNPLYWEKRLFFYDLCYEIQGYKIIGQYNEYKIVGDHRIAYIPVIGVEFKNYINDWVIYGSINKTEEPYPCAIVGDTLAVSFFEAATFQKIQFNSGNSRQYKITGVLIDSFCAGNATYVPLDSIRNDLNITDKINLGVVKLNVKDNQMIMNFTNEINEYLRLRLGEDFLIINLDPTFVKNINSISRYTNLIWIIESISNIIIIWGIIYFNNATLHEKIRDYLIIYAIGGSKKIIQKIILYENFLIILLALIIAFGLALNILLLIIFPEAIRPSILIVLIP